MREMPATTSESRGQVNREFMRGVLALAKAQALQHGLSWPALVAQVRAAVGDDHMMLLDLVTTVERPRLVGAVSAQGAET